MNEKILERIKDKAKEIWQLRTVLDLNELTEAMDEYADLVIQAQWDDITDRIIEQRCTRGELQ